MAVVEAAEGAVVAAVVAAIVVEAVVCFGQDSPSEPYKFQVTFEFRISLRISRLVFTSRQDSSVCPYYLTHIWGIWIYAFF